MATYCNTDPNCPAEIRVALGRIEEAAGQSAVSHENPCGVAAYYDEGADRPWRIADDWNSASFATADEAAVEAEAWSDEE